MFRRRVQVVVVLLVVVGAASLVVPGINRVRETANRARCQNNLKQIALAVHNYNDAYQGKLPPLVDQGENSQTGQGILSIFGTVVPYVEAGPRYYDPKQSPPTDYHAHSSVLFTYRDKMDAPFTENGGMANRV